MTSPKKAIFAAEFNELARPGNFNLSRFLQVAQEHGWTEVRVHNPGETLVYAKHRHDDRITAQLDEAGNVKRYLQG